MKELTFNQMDGVKGGFNTFWRSACAVWAGLSYFKLITYATPATAALGKAVDITCIIVGIEAAVDALID
ncbi:MAG: hypothetical protein R2758_00800 [Bacteroidales bacterium]